MDGAVVNPVDSTADAELRPIAALCAGAVMRMEAGGLRYIHMEGLKFYVRGEQRQMDALLCLNYPNGPACATCADARAGAAPCCQGLAPFFIICVYAAPQRGRRRWYSA